MHVARTSLAFAFGTIVTAWCQDGPIFHPLSHAVPEHQQWASTLVQLDEDGAIDLVTVGRVASTDAPVAWIRLGRGDGTFEDPTTLPLPYLAIDIVTADFDGDGFADVALTAPDADVVLVLHGDGLGGLGPPTAHALGQDSAGPTLDVADVDGDGSPDLVVGAGLAPFLSVLLNDGGGQFEVQSYLAGGKVTELAVADANQDGRDDVIVAYPEKVLIGALLADGRGALAPPIFSTPHWTPEQFAMADLSGDGVPDLVYRFDTLIGLMEGRGNGFFRKWTVFEPDLALWDASSLSVADLDSDGLVELLVGRSYESQLRIRRGLGGASFGPVQAVPVNSCWSLDFADLDGDGFLDACVQDSIDGGVATLFGKGDGTLQAADTDILLESSIGIGMPTGDVVFEDVDRDGCVDLVAQGIAAGATSVVVVVALGQCDGSFRPTQAVTFPVQLSGLDTGDVDGDGNIDLLVLRPGALDVLIDGGAGFAVVWTQSIPSLPVTRPKAGDLDGDGLDDAVVYSSGTKSHYVLRATGGGALGAPVAYPAGDSAPDHELADLDGDGDLDLLVSTFSGISARFNDGAAVFGAPATLSGYWTPDLVVGDFDADGDPDIALPQFNGYAFGPCDGAVILRGVGAGAFVEDGCVPTGHGVEHGLSADFDHDGVPDLLVSHYSSHDLGLLLGRRDGSFSPSQRLCGTFGNDPPASLRSADVNGDGYEDLLITESQAVQLLLNGYGAWKDLGFPLPGVATTGAEPPRLRGGGPMTPGSVAQVGLSGARATSRTILFIGPSPAWTPFLGGILVPNWTVAWPAMTDSLGEAAWSIGVPSGAEPPFTLVLQAWVEDPSGPAGASASNGLRARTP